MVTVNVVVLAGRLSADPEFAEMPSGDTVAKLRLQVPEAGKRVLPPPHCGLGQRGPEGL
jgi:Single-strand binding protein family